MAIGLLNPWVWLVTLALLAGTYVKGRFDQSRADTRAQAEAKFTESESARLRERAAQVNAQRIADEKEAKSRRRIAQLSADLAGLRNRADRLPEPARAACSGATGAELSRRDSEFLTRLGSRGDDLRDALDACQQREAVSP